MVMDTCGPAGGEGGGGNDARTTAHRPYRLRVGQLCSRHLFAGEPKKCTAAASLYDYYYCSTLASHLLPYGLRLMVIRA